MQGKRARLTAIRLGLMLLAGVPLISLSAPGDALAASRSRTTSDDVAGFRSAGRHVTVEAFRAAGGGDKPAVIMLHGAHGIGRGTLIYPYAQALAASGISTFVVHYFDGIAAGHKAAAGLHAARERVIEDALAYVQSLGGIDAERVGMIGVSLGGFHALGLASSDERIQAVVNIFGAMPQVTLNTGVTRMPPTLILHGDRDPIVPVGRAYQLRNILERVGSDWEMTIYRGQGHNFTGSAYGDSIQRAVNFFQRHLAPLQQNDDIPAETVEVAADVVEAWPAL